MIQPFVAPGVAYTNPGAVLPIGSAANSSAANGSLEPLVRACRLVHVCALLSRVLLLLFGEPCRVHDTECVTLRDGEIRVLPPFRSCNRRCQNSATTSYGTPTPYIPFTIAVAV